MDTMIGRFQLTTCTPTKAAVYDTDASGRADYSRRRMVPSARIAMHAVTGGNEDDQLFGRLTPSGSLEMTVANPTVAAWLAEVWHGWVTSEEENATLPRFEVAFRLLADDE